MTVSLDRKDDTETHRGKGPVKTEEETRGCTHMLGI